MKVMVTGGLGFIGSHLVERLLAEGHKVVVFDDLESGREENIASSLRSRYLEVARGDIRKLAQIRRALSGTHLVIHLAAKVSVQRSVEDPETAMEVNANGTLNLLQESAKAGVKRLIFASTTAVYGNKTTPLREDSGLDPLSPYAVSKLAGENYCRAFSKSKEVETVILRLFNVYGPRTSTGPYAGVMVRFAQAIVEDSPLVIFGDGRQTRDFVHVDDVVGAMMLASAKKGIDGEVFNIGTGIGTSIGHLATTFLSIARRGGEKAIHNPPREAEVRYSVASIAKAKRLLEYRPRIRLEAGVRRYLEWFRAR
jgi:nucleoside-diphosphate-sugar epimerase